MINVLNHKKGYKEQVLNKKGSKEQVLNNIGEIHTFSWCTSIVAIKRIK